MQKKYKHKKTGHIATRSTVGEYYVAYIHTVPVWVVEEGDDWEPVVEKEWEILSFYFSLDNNFIWRKIEGKETFTNTIGNELVWTTKEFLEHSDYTIYSIKRLSDGEVFTVGDKVSYGSEIIIEVAKIQLFQNDLFLVNSTNNKSCYLRKAKKLKPLFTTIDGIDIYNGDKYFYLDDKNNIWECNYAQLEHGLSTKNFSTKEAAEKYILMNKLVFSVNDIAEIVKESGLVEENILNSVVKVLQNQARLNFSLKKY